MALTRPFSSLSLREDLNRLMREMDQEFFSPLMPRTLPTRAELLEFWAPSVDVTETEKEIKLKAEVPGIKPDDLEIEVENNALILSGESRKEMKEEKENVHRQEIMYGKFFRRIPLPSEVKADMANAEFENGILTITLPKSEESRRHKIRLRKQK